MELSEFTFAFVLIGYSTMIVLLLTIYYKSKDSVLFQNQAKVHQIEVVEQEPHTVIVVSPGEIVSVGVKPISQDSIVKSLV